MGAGDRLDSWREIARYLNRGTRTCHRWEEEYDLPVHRVSMVSPRSQVFAYKTELDEWLKQRKLAEAPKKKTFFHKKSVGVPLGILVPLLFVAGFLLYGLIRSRSKPAEPCILGIASFEMSGAGLDHEYFCRGVQTGIANGLQISKQITVVTTNLDFKGQSISDSLGQAQNTLPLDYVLQGNMKKQDDTFALDLHLVRARDEKKIWEQSFEEKLENVALVQKMACRRIYAALKLKLDLENPVLVDDLFFEFQSDNKHLKASDVQDSISRDEEDSSRLYSKGQYYYARATEEANEVAIRLFSKALEIDSAFAEAYIWLALCYLNTVNFAWDEKLEWLDKAEAMLQRANAITPGLPEYYYGLIKTYLIKYVLFDQDTKSLALDLAEEGLHKYPRHSDVASIVGYCFFLEFGETGNEAAFRRALELKDIRYWQNPSVVGNIVFTEFLLLNRSFHRALRICNEIGSKGPLSFVDSRRGEIHYYFGDLDQSEYIFRQMESPLRTKVFALEYLGMIAAQKGEKEKAIKILQQLNVLSTLPFGSRLRIASILMGLGREEQGFDQLDTFFEDQYVRKMKYAYKKYMDLDRNFDRVRNKIWRRYYESKEKN